MKKWKILTAVLCAALLSICLAACGGSSSGSGGQQSGGSASSASSNKQMKGLYGPNLSDLLTKSGPEAAALLENLEEYTYESEYSDGTSYYYGNNTDLSAYVSSGGHTEDGDYIEFPRQDGVYTFQLGNYDEDLHRMFKYSKADLAEGHSRNPNYVEYYLYLEKKPSAEELANIVDSITSFDKGYFYARDSNDLRGSAKGNGCVCTVEAYTSYSEDGTSVMLKLYSINGSSFGKDTANEFDAEYASYDSSNYSDSYVK